MKYKKMCQWARLNNGINTLCGKETQFYGFVFFALTIIENSLSNYLDAKADEIKLANKRIEDITEKEAFERIADLYPARPEEIKGVLEDYYSGELVKRFYVKTISENERLLKSKELRQ